VTDYFALLGEPRQPWLDEEELKSKFFALSATVHPDRAHALPEADRNAAHERYTELNTAYNCLREPKERLRHLIELHTGRKPAQVQQVPQPLVDIFFQIGQACREADEFLKRKTAVNSPLLLAGLFEEGQTISDRLADLRQGLAGQQKQLLADLKNLSAEWEQDLARLETIQQTLSYLQRWQAQLQERFVQLAL
jgi:curved DNA-binding protein CbpA